MSARTVISDSPSLSILVEAAWSIRPMRDSNLAHVSLNVFSIEIETCRTEMVLWTRCISWLPFECSCMRSYPFPDGHGFDPRDHFDIVRQPIVAVFPMAKSHRRKVV